MFVPRRKNSASFRWILVQRLRVWVAIHSPCYYWPPRQTHTCVRLYVVKVNMERDTLAPRRSPPPPTRLRPVVVLKFPRLLLPFSHPQDKPTLAVVWLKFALFPRIRLSLWTSGPVRSASGSSVTIPQTQTCTHTHTWLSIVVGLSNTCMRANTHYTHISLTLLTGLLFLLTTSTWPPTAAAPTEIRSQSEPGRTVQKRKSSLLMAHFTGGFSRVLQRNPSKVSTPVHTDHTRAYKLRCHIRIY